MSHLAAQFGSILPLFFTQNVIVVTITNPTSGSTVTDAIITVQWTFTPGTQLSYLVQVFDDPAGTSLVYSSGITVSAVLEHEIPAGSLENLTTYYVKVSIVTTDGQAGESVLVDFDTSFAPSGGVTGVQTFVFDACTSPQDFPRVEVRWDQVVPGGGETFTEYRVRRRQGGVTAWTTLAVVDDITVTSFTDELPGGFVYEYSVIWVADASGDTLVSVGLGVIAIVDFDMAWLQPVSNPRNGVRFATWELDQVVMTDVTVGDTAGSPAPTGFVGERLYDTISLPGLSLIASNPQWTSLRDFLADQLTGEIFCLRHGRQGIRKFGIIPSVSRHGRQGDYLPTVQFIETRYQEGV